MSCCCGRLGRWPDRRLKLRVKTREPAVILHHPRAKSQYFKFRCCIAETFGIENALNVNTLCSSVREPRLQSSLSDLAVIYTHYFE